MVAGERERAGPCSPCFGLRVQVFMWSKVGTDSAIAGCEAERGKSSRGGESFEGKMGCDIEYGGLNLTVGVSTVGIHASNDRRDMYAYGIPMWL